MFNFFKKKTKFKWEITNCSRCRSTNIIPITTKFIGTMEHYDTAHVVITQKLPEEANLSYFKCKDCGAVTYIHINPYLRDAIGLPAFSKEKDYIELSIPKLKGKYPQYSTIEVIKG